MRTYDYIKDAFEKCINREENAINCKLGLWGVSSPNQEMIEKSARHYWIQYFNDGEYKNILKDND